MFNKDLLVSVAIVFYAPPRGGGGVGLRALNDWKSGFLRIIDIRMDGFTRRPRLFGQPLGSLGGGGGMEKLHRRCVIAPADRAANGVIIVWKGHCVGDLG